MVTKYLKEILHFSNGFTLFTALMLIFSIGLHSRPQKDNPLPCLNKKFTIIAHIVKDSLENEGTNEAAILLGIDSLNSSFSKICVSFEVCEFRYIDNFQYDTLKWDNEWDEINIKYAEENRINLFLVSSILDEEVCGKAPIGGISGSGYTSICVLKSCANPFSFTIPHEMGHFFGLLHTFDDSSPELVDGSNCKTAGDGICDTPADPYVFPEPIEDYAKNCKFISEKKDANSMYYNPDITNIMSYYQCLCRFSDGQYRKMVETYLSSNPKMW